MEPQFGKYGVEYNMDGKRWALNVMAADEAGAMRRLKQAAAFGTVCGREVMSIPIPGGMTALRLTRWITNVFKR